MKSDVVIPRLGSSDESDDLKLVRWIKQVGASVQKGESLLEVETDKVTVEIEAPASGRLVETLAKEGDVVKINSVVAIIENND